MSFLLKATYIKIYTASHLKYWVCGFFVFIGLDFSIFRFYYTVVYKIIHTIEGLPILVSNYSRGSIFGDYVYNGKSTSL
jgi:hypothetical protein